MYHIIIVIISKKIYCKSKNSHEQNVLRIRFYICCANFITISELPIVLYIYIAYMKTKIVIISKNKSEIKKFS